ncbi:hypothetical protein [Nitrospira sp. M1]
MRGRFARAGPMDPSQHDAPWCVGAGDWGKGGVWAQALNRNPGG